ncbi:MAG TPA: prolyl oligopeptidase family serine peptidase, partial [Candidatus Saccharimonadales bacterium]|nr:prolyl oligopeptidase family serine peptidase [Candidatus Saccharimonadales bacterium]
NQPVLLVRDGDAGPDRALVDPNAFAADGTSALDWWYPSRDGRFLAYGISDRGSELSVLRVLDVATGRDLGEIIPQTRACSLAWDPGADGFFYTRYPSPGTVPEGEEMYHRRVFHHRLGDDPRSDAPVFGEGRPLDAWPNVALSPSGRWLVVMEAEGWIRTRVYLRDLRSGGGWISLVDESHALYAVTPLDDRLLVHTNEDAPAWRLMSADPERPAREEWKDLIPEGPDVLQSIEVAGGRIFAACLRDAASELRVHAMDGALLGTVGLPPRGTVTFMDGEEKGDVLFTGYVSFTVPPMIYRHAIRSGRTEPWATMPSPIDGDGFETRQIHCTSRDGTRIPIFVIHRAGMKRDGRNPVLLTGYGGFNVPLTPSFDRESFVWLESGGVVAVAILRGGGEFGETWHRAGMLESKQNVFDDFIAAAEHLIREGYTGPERLAIRGGSNGGLLVGAALTQRPDLFRAVVCRVPLLDMIRYHRFRIARLWIPEYGCSEDPEQFRWLIAYSPYHNVRDGVAYPAVLLTTAEADSRVDPMHALKMAARLQQAQAAPERPVLLRVESRAGHGAGKPLSKQLDEQVDVWSFLFRELGVDPPAAAQGGRDPQPDEAPGR